MATLAEVERALAEENPADGVIVCDAGLRLLAFRPPMDGAAAHLLVLGEPNFGVECSVRPDAYNDVRPVREGGDDAAPRAAQEPSGALGLISAPEEPPGPKERRRNPPVYGD